MHKSATRLEKQCERYELEIERILVRPIKNSELWVGSDGSEKRPEEIALEHYTQRGCSGSWCEGGTLNLLMKAASLPVLVRYNIFADPDDAIRRFFEAQCVILADHRSEILHAIESSQTSNIEAAYGCRRSHHDCRRAASDGPGTGSRDDPRILELSDGGDRTSPSRDSA